MRKNFGRFLFLDGNGFGNFGDFCYYCTNGIEHLFLSCFAPQQILCKHRGQIYCADSVICKEQRSFFGNTLGKGAWIK